MHAVSGALAEAPAGAMPIVTSVHSLHVLVWDAPTFDHAHAGTGWYEKRVYPGRVLYSVGACVLLIVCCKRSLCCGHARTFQEGLFTMLVVVCFLKKYASLWVCVAFKFKLSFGHEVSGVKCPQSIPTCRSVAFNSHHTSFTLYVFTEVGSLNKLRTCFSRVCVNISQCVRCTLYDYILSSKVGAW